MARIATTRRAASLSGLRRREAVEGLLLVSPWVVGLVVFILGPLIASAYLSLTNYTVTRSPRFLGLDNYVRALTDDPIFWVSVERTALYVALLVPPGVAASLGCALLLNRELRATTLFRTLFFLPSLTPVVASAILWTWIFQPEVGAEAVYYASQHDVGRELLVAWPTVKTVYGNMVAPDYLDHYLADAAYAGEQTAEREDPNRPDNLFDPVPGDWAAHGRFDDRAREGSVELALRLNRGWLAVAGAGVAGVLLGALTGRNGASPNGSSPNGASSGTDDATVERADSKG